MVILISVNLAFGTLINLSIFAQNKIKYILDSKIENIWIPDSSEESSKVDIKDSTSKSLYIVFEKWFDDSVQILLNNKIVISDRIKTNKYTSVVEREKEFKVDYKFIKNPLIEIRLVGQGRKIRFSPKEGYVICYINRLIKQWKLSFSNYVRDYR